MPTEIIVPRLGWSMEQGAFVAWLKGDGDNVQAGEPLFSIEGDKAAQEIESIDSGILRIAPNAPQPGDPVRVGDVLGHLVSDGEAVVAIATDGDASTRAAKLAAAPSPMPSAVVHRSVPPGNPKFQRSTPAISPRARRIAGELGIPWTTLQGSGQTGRIRERDIRAAHSTARSPGSDTRRVIARRMLDSLRNTAPVTLHTTVDATRLVELRRQFKAAATGTESVPSYLDMLVQLTAHTLPQHPSLNARWVEGKLVPTTELHIGIAIDTTAGLVVPVLRNAGGQSLARGAAQSQDLIARARARQLSADEIRGGTFTITSLGAFGIDAFTPIINYPEVAILGIGRIQQKPAVVAGQIAPRDILTLSLTFDHCALDGAPAARFLQALTALIENPTVLT